MIELTVRIVLSLLVVLGVLWLLTRLGRGPAGRAGRAVTLLGRQQLSRGSAVAVVRVGDRALVLGVTEQRVSLLAETDLAGLTDQLAAADGPVGVGPAGSGGGALAGSLLSPATWRQAIDAVRDRTVRR